jgi:hypothetical protein
MVAAVLPDPTQLVVDYLRATAEVTAKVGTRVWAIRKPKEPPTVAEPYVLVQRLGGTKAVPRRLDAPRIQIDVWGGSEYRAHEAARIINAAMWEIHKITAATHPAIVAIGIPTGVDEESGPSWLPDPVDPGNTPRSRFTQTFTVYVHPKDP